MTKIKMFNYIKEDEDNFEHNIKSLVNSRMDLNEEITDKVSEILKNVKEGGNESLFKYMEELDGIKNPSKNLFISQTDIEEAKAKCSEESLQALALAKKRIEEFHLQQMPKDSLFSDDQKINIKTRWIALESVGVYIPGGKASYPSSVLMTIIPAQIAGVKKIKATIPCPNNRIDPLVLAALDLCNIEEIYKIGGSHAIAALTWGTETISKVDIIIGPGNKWVAEAKKQVIGNVKIDLIAGPSEILIISDTDTNPEWVAADLIAQAEHDETAQAILITDDVNFAKKVDDCIRIQISKLSRSMIISESLKNNGYAIVVNNLSTSADIANTIAPEHLSILCKDYEIIEKEIINAGVIFTGVWTPEAMGDYIIGSSHVLPTNGMAKNYSGLSVFNFLRRQSTITGERETIKTLGPPAVIIAECEGLDAHANSIRLRLKD